MDNIRFIGKIPKQAPEYFIWKAVESQVSKLGLTQTEWSIHRVLTGSGQEVLQADAMFINLISSFGEDEVKRICLLFGIKIK